MSELIVIGFDDEFKAEQMRLDLAKLQREHLLDLEDAAVVVKNKQGKLQLKQAYNLVGAGAVSGSFWGLLIGLIFLNPLLGVAAGAAGGALSGALADIGVDDDFIREVGNSLEPGSSALFILVRKATPDKVLQEIRNHQFEGKVIQTSLSYEDEAKLQEALQAKQPLIEGSSGSGSSGC